MKRGENLNKMINEEFKGFKEREINSPCYVLGLLLWITDLSSTHEVLYLYYRI